MRQLHQTSAVTGTVTAEFHPDRPDEPDTGAVKAVEVNGAEWPKMPFPNRLGLELHDGLPAVTDSLYGEAFVPFWLHAAYEAAWSAFQFDVLPVERLQGVVDTIAASDDLRAQMEGALRVGMRGLDLFESVVDNFL